jgi:hypothetical protein
MSQATKPTLSASENGALSIFKWQGKRKNLFLWAVLSLFTLRRRTTSKASITAVIPERLMHKVHAFLKISLRLQSRLY